MTRESQTALRWIVDRTMTLVGDAGHGLRAGGATTVLALAILAVTLTAATVTYSVIDATALRPLPYSSPERLVDLSQPGPIAGRSLPASPQQYVTWIEQTSAFASIGAARFQPPIQLAVDGTVESLSTRAVSVNLFVVLGVQPVVGRLFGLEHERPGAQPAVILSHGLWVRRFHADPTIVGRRLPFVDGSREVLGVLPRDVSYPLTAGDPPEAYVPYVPTAADRANSRAFSMFVVARLREGVRIEGARADIARVSSGIVRPLEEQVAGPHRSSLLLILTAVGVVVLVACLNVATLMLARAATRRREFAIRESLGASRRQLALTLVTEALMLSGAAVAAALLFSVWGVEAAKPLLPIGLSRVSEIGVDGRVLAAAALAAICCALVYGTAPAWRVAQADLVTDMKSSGGGVISGGRHLALAAFLVANVSFVYLLLVATTLVISSFVFITTADIGFDRRHLAVVTYQRTLTGGARQAAAEAATLRADLLQRARAVPGVTHAAIVVNGGTPLSGSHVRYGLTIPGVGEVRGDDALEMRAVTPEYFSTMGMTVLRGRTLLASDRAGAPAVMLINDVAARRFFPGRDPVGEVVTFRGATTIVGVLRSVNYDGPEVDAPPEMYVPADQEKPYPGDRIFGFLVVRSTADPETIAAALREAIRPAITGEPAEPQFVEHHFRRLTAARRFNAQLMSAFGIVALMIGGLGVFATMSFVVTQQVPAFGLRLTLGATPGRILRSVLRAALLRVIAGLSIGAVAANSLAASARSFVFGIQPGEPLVLAGIALFLVVVALIAALAPGLRAARVDPLVTIRQE